MQNALGAEAPLPAPSAIAPAAGSTLTVNQILDAYLREKRMLRKMVTLIGWLTPVDYARQWARKEELEGRPSWAFDGDRIPVPAG